MIDWPNMPLCHVALLCALMNCFLNSFWPSDIIWWHRFGSTLVQVMACCLMAQSHFLNQCCVIISEVFSHSPDGNFTGNSQDIYPWCEFDIYLFKFTAMSPRGQWVNRVSSGQGKVREIPYQAKVRELSGNFVMGQGKLKMLWKVREKSGNI